MEASRRISKRLLWIGGAVVAAVLAFAVFEPIQVLPRMRLAPGYALVDADGSVFTSDNSRGKVTLYSFLPAGCGHVCDDTLDTMADVARRSAAEVDLGSVDFQLVTILLDGDRETAADLAAAHHADGVAWHFLTGSEEDVDLVVGSGFDVFFERGDDGGLAFDRVFTIVDTIGTIRGEYRYVTLSPDSDRLTRHLSLLGDEMRNATGAGAIAYEAAHLFLCYP